METHALLSELHRRTFRPKDVMRNQFSLTKKGVADFYSQRLSSLTMTNFVARMDAVDSWTFDFDELNQPDATTINDFINNLEGLVLLHAEHLHVKLVELTSVLSRLTSSRCIYILHYLSIQNERFLPLFIDHIDRTQNESVESLSVIKRLIAFYRAELIGEIFSKKRIGLVLSVLKANDHG